METDARKILWADDEIELLRSHQLFLNDKGFEVTPVNNGEDAVAMVQQENFDIVLLDEMMPGLDGLQTLEQIKQLNSNIPIIMITKSEEEHLMDEARSLAETLLARGPLALRAAKQAVLEGAGLSMDEGLALELGLFSNIMRTEDAAEGPRAFAEKRTPNYQGR